MSSTLPPLGKNKILALLERNPPDLYTALSSALNDTDFNDAAINAATSKKLLIEKIRPMNTKDLKRVLTAVQPYLEVEERLVKEFV